MCLFPKFIVSLQNVSQEWKSEIDIFFDHQTIKTEPKHSYLSLAWRSVA